MSTKASDYSVAHREDAEDGMAAYPGFGELRFFTAARHAAHVYVDHVLADGQTLALVAEQRGRVIGLAYVKPEQSKLGSSIEIRVDRGEMIRATVVRTPFYDPENLRQTPVSELQEVS